MVKLVVIVLCAVGLLHTSSGLLTQAGQCSDLSQFNNFDISRFLGVWIERRRSFGSFGEGSDCSTIELNYVNDTYFFNNTAVENNFKSEQNGTITVSGSTLRLLLDGESEPVNFVVLDTNYDHFALVYTCKDIGTNSREVIIYQLERTTAIITEMMEEWMNTTLTDNFGLLLGDLRIVYHTDVACYELPEMDTEGPVLLPGTCSPDITVVQDFDVEKFLGLWHEIASYYSENALGDCARADYSLGDGGVNVLNSQVVDQTLLTISGNATVVSTDGSALLEVSLEIAPGVFQKQNLTIISTDYTNYAISYSCVDVPEEDGKRIFSWILGRSPELSQASQAAVDQVIRSEIELNYAFYHETNRTDGDCFYFPEPNGLPVKFRGQCDKEIPVVADFDPIRYLGLWHNIQSYPSQFQFGTCSNAYYSLNENGSVDVFNTQVIDEELATINGVAVLDDDEPAKLVVSFPIEGTNLTTFTDYWVLATDYSTYSLVYSCQNLENNERTVSSWKLGRAKSLNANALEAIDKVIATIPVLNEQYYKTDDQTEKGCFYYPEPQEGTTVTFPGQCDNDIKTVENFNLQRFAGIWNEIETYPKEQVGGNCISHEYTYESGNTLTLTSRQILDQLLIETNGTATAVAANSGKLTIKITSEGEEIEFPFWILATDYDNYAVAYSCVNIDENFRNIYSWKLSRDVVLESQYYTAINEAIEPIDVLQDRYYETVDQSLDACFYMPDLEPGAEVILVGNCETDIPVVQEFDASKYEGTWRLISSYPTEFQGGTCNDATYTILPDGKVEVLNTQVINEALDTIVGTAEVASDDGSAKLLVSFPTTDQLSDYWVLDTDYESYSLVYSCKNINDRERQIFSWKLSRTNVLSDAAIQKMDAVIANISVLNNRYYEDIDRSDEACFYYPEPDGKPVKFRGQCDETIPVVNNFEPGRYLGLWHSIESFPSFFSDGQCNNAEYSLLETGQVNVLNTEVINETLIAMVGVANISEENPAKLVVTFPSVSTDAYINYWVLDTDYDSYSLVYSCQNSGPEHREVWSWKLSRTKQLSPAAITAIDLVTSKIDVLDKKYYEEKIQTDDACFYYPEPSPGIPVTFPGECKDINVMSNFNMTKFLGQWNEIEAYPIGEKQGECTNHIISEATSNSWTVVTNNVNNQSLDVANGVLTVSGTANEQAKLSLTISIAAKNVTLPIWIIDTDYETYAIVYSCVNNNDIRGTRNVYSWKLSRGYSLSSSAITAINDAIQSIGVLQDIYYETVDQSLDACFYLPDLAPGAPVEMVGQCETDIPVVQEFDAEKYMGPWRMISSYPSDFQVGTCNDATYSLLSNGTVEVFNTQVVDETLDTIIGSAVVASDDGSAKLSVKFPTSDVWTDYWVLDTDYTSYSLVYSCKNINDRKRRIFSWILSRTNYLSEDAVQNISSVIANVTVLDNRYYEDVDRSEDACFYYTEPDGKPVVFRGQCNETIQVVQDFLPDKYEGQWYAIESYPIENQFGTCQTASYTLNRETGVVSVLNTQVYNQTLDSIEATAVLASNDGSAKLEVTFPLPGGNVVTPYWVLSTDYDNYALVYSCSNVNEDYMRVSTWKLSRNTTLSETSNETINSVMRDIKVLDQRYHILWGHSDEDCFFYPELTDGQVLLDGQCGDTDVTAVKEFNVSKFAGNWYEAERFPSNLQMGDCVENKFEMIDSKTFTITITIVYNERQRTFSGPATIADDGTGVFDTNLTDGDVSINLDLYVLGTDYENYAILYSCINFDENRKQILSWKLSRSESGLTEDAVNEIDEIVTDIKDLDHRYYEKTEHNNDKCFHYPEFDELPDGIELPGPCDSSIKGIENFDVSRYTGRWYEIERYPQASQYGTCNRAMYTLNDGVVEVLNSEVVDMTLSTRAGTAALASTDGSGVLSVTFIIDSEPRDATLYVLSTDYENYSLAYSCRNLENGKRLVASWKLSRSKALSSEASEIIDKVIESTQGLNQDYYVVTSQSDESCFYVPEVDLEAAPLFPLRCEDITGVQNFDMTKFLGVWHEIESYPRDTDAGECISSDYASSGNQFTVIDTRIFNVTADIVSSTIQANNNGRLLKVTSSGSTTVESEIWVLATDYESYALLYSCENDGDEYRRVWSAKLSRSRISEFPEEAQKSMDAVIEDNKVLYPQFYQQIDQSDNACFHYPEQNGQQIILPGKCDENIPVVENFNAVEYTGTWYQIERYPQIHESGNCTGARYTLDEETGVVTVLNWEVIDGELETIEGIATINSTDGSAKLMVNLPIRDSEDGETTETSLYVLTTDYVSYSLAYSCVNIDGHRRAVGAWKLSRTRNMTDAGNEAIDKYMSTREEFHQPFFIETTQYEGCDEPSSSVLFRSSIIVTLGCLVVKALL